MSLTNFNDVFFVPIKGLHFQNVFTKEASQTRTLISLDCKTTSSALSPATSEGSLAFLLSRLAPGIAIRDVDPLGSVNAKIAQVAKV